MACLSIRALKNSTRKQQNNLLTNREGSGDRRFLAPPFLDDEATMDNVTKALEKEEGMKRSLNGLALNVMNGIAIVLALYTLHTAIFGMTDAMRFRSIHLLLALPIVLLLYPAARRYRQSIPLFDYLLVAVSVLCIGYFVLFSDDLNNRIVFVTPLTTVQYLAGIGLTLIILEATRRVVGLVLSLISILFIVYAFSGPFLPEAIGHSGFSLSDVVEQFTMSSEGIFGSVLGVIATYVAMFVLLAAFLDISGTGQFFIDLAIAMTGKTRGGPAKAAVIGSGLMGSISGSAVANVVTTGTFTIPLMKRTGYKAEFAGAVESVASTGGQLMPPIMSSTGFIMADFLGIPYIKVAFAAFIPAMMYYIALYVMVDAEASRLGLKGISKEDLPRLAEVIKRWFLSIPLVAVVYALVAGYSPMTAGLYAWYATIALIVLAQLKGITPNLIKGILNALSSGMKNLVPVSITVACAGFIIGVITLTGFGLKITGLLIYLSGGYLPAALILTMLACIVIGMGLPTLPAYLVSVALIVPALAALGLQPVVAHFFVLYFAVISCITPPVAIAAYAAGGIAKANPMDVGWQSVRLAFAGYLVPFIFAYQPQLLLIGTPIEIINVTITCLGGVTALAWATIGFLNTKMNIPERLLFLLSAFLLIDGGLATDIAGLVILVGMYIYLKTKQRRIAVRGALPEK
ncbi:MAG: TRAP transporter permease [Deltaproteobacteria bacterium]|nr:TRAP transporter permease [Deltaproteobacteria bacterium]